MPKRPSEPPVYLDHHATTPLDPRVLEAMLPFYREHFGNAASQSHVFGWRAEAAVEAARERLAEAVGVEPRELVFTSGATEANNLALLGGFEARRAHRDHVVSVVTEHRAVLDPCRALEARGARLTLLPVDAEGMLDPASLAAVVDERTALVSVMWANNEIGVLQAIPELAAICREQGAWFHSDAAQAVGKVPVDATAAGVDLLSFTAHKVYGPKGVGALSVRARAPRVRLSPQVFGGGHERGLRSGTLPVALIVGFAEAVALAGAERAAEAERTAELAALLWDGLSAGLEGVERHGHPTRRLPGNLNVSFAGIDADALIADLPGVAISTGSACSSASPEPSHVLSALGLDEARIRGAVRFGIGRGNSREEIERATGRVCEAVRALRAAPKAPSLARR